MTYFVEVGTKVYGQYEIEAENIEKVKEIACNLLGEDIGIGISLEDTFDWDISEI